MDLAQMTNLMKATLRMVKGGATGLATHFKRAAAHHEEKAASHHGMHKSHDTMKASHEGMVEACKAMMHASEKANVSDPGSPGTVPTGTITDFHKAMGAFAGKMMDHHAAKAAHHAAKSAHHLAVHKAHGGMCEHCKTMANINDGMDKAVKADGALDAPAAGAAPAADGSLAELVTLLKANAEASKPESLAKMIADAVKAQIAAQPEPRAALTLVPMAGNLIPRDPPEGSQNGITKAAGSPAGIADDGGFGGGV